MVETEAVGLDLTDEEPHGFKHRHGPIDLCPPSAKHSSGRCATLSSCPPDAIRKGSRYRPGSRYSVTPLVSTSRASARNAGQVGADVRVEPRLAQLPEDHGVDLQHM